MTDDLDILIARYLDGVATPEEVGRLEDLIVRDRGTAREVWRAAYLDALLRDGLTQGVVVQGEEAGTAAEPDSFGQPGPRPVRLPVSGDADRQEGGPAAGGGWAAGRNIPAKPAGRVVRLDPRGSPLARFGWAAAACLVVGLVGYVAWRASRPTTGLIVDRRPIPSARLPVSSQGAVITGSGGTRSADANAQVAPGEQIRTGPAGASLAFDGETTRLQLAPKSTVSLGADAAKHFVLDSGRMTCQVDKQSREHPLVIATPQARVTVVGTRFDVVTAGGATRVQVTQGTVRVQRLSDNVMVDVSAGEYVDVAGMPAAGQSARVPWPPPAGAKDMSAFWSDKVKPAGIDQ